MLKKKRIEILEDGIAKLNEFYFLLIDWMKIHYMGLNLEDYFIERDYNRIAVYGMKELGDCLVEELRNSKVEIVCGIDRDAEYIIQDVPMKPPDVASFTTTSTASYKYSKRIVGVPCAA